MASCTALCRSASLRGLAVQLPNAAAFLEAVLAVDHDVLARLQALIDQRLPVADLRDGDGTHCGRLLGAITT